MTKNYFAPDNKDNSCVRCKCKQLSNSLIDNYAVGEELALQSIAKTLDFGIKNLCVEYSIARLTGSDLEHPKVRIRTAVCHLSSPL